MASGVFRSGGIVEVGKRVLQGITRVRKGYVGDDGLGFRAIP